MPQLGLYTATENELGAVQRAAGEVDADLVVRSESDLDDEPAVEAFVDELTDADAVVLWLHGAEDSMPGYEMAVERLREAGVPLVVKATGDAFAFEDTSVRTSTATRLRLPRQGGASNVANCVRYLVAQYGDADPSYDEPVTLPTDGVYHPDHPGASIDELRATHDPAKPTVGVWFYESHWTHANTRYVDALVGPSNPSARTRSRVLEPATDAEGQWNAEQVTEEWLLDADGNPLVDAVARRSCSRCRWTNAGAAPTTKARAPRTCSSTNSASRSSRP